MKNIDRRKKALANQGLLREKKIKYVDANLLQVLL